MAETRPPRDWSDALGDEGTCVERGAFRLDWQRARHKIQDFKLAEPHAYVLELIQAAVAAGASRIDVKMDADDMHLAFDGRPYTRAELDGLFDSLFSQDPGRARLKQLALGVVTGLGLGPKFLRVTSGDGHSAARLTLTSLEDTRLEVLEPGPAEAGTRVHLREKMSWKVVSEALFRPNPEEGLLRDRCRFCPLPITLDGEDLRWPLSSQVASVVRLEFSDQATSGELVLPTQPGDRSELIICLRGVQIVREQLAGSDWLATAGLHIRIDDHELTRNASHTDVQRDEAFNRCMARVRTAALDLVRAWVRSELLGLAPEPTETGTAEVAPLASLSFEARTHLLRLAARALVWPDAPARGGPCVGALLDAPDLVELPFDDELFGPLRPVVEAFARDGTCRLASRRYRIDPDERARAPVAASGPKDFLRDLFGAGRMLDADEALTRLELRCFNRRARLAARRAPVLPPGDYLVRRPLSRATDPVMQGELSLSAEPEDEASLQVDWLLGGAPMVTLAVKPWPFDGRAEIDCAALVPNELWDGVEPDDAYHACLDEVRAAVPALLASLREAFPMLPPPPALAKLGWWHPKCTPDLLLSQPAFSTSHPRFSAARRQADWMLAEQGLLPREAAAWLWDWPLFYTLQGQVRCLDEIVATCDPVGFVTEERFMSEPALGPDRLVLNLAGQQARLLGALLGERLVDCSEELDKARDRLSRQAQGRQKRAQNLSLARSKAQAPVLPGLRMLARADLPAELGRGQVGLPLASERSFIRVLIDGLPLYELDIDPARLPFCVEAVIEPVGMEADETFSKLKLKSDRRKLRQAVVDALPALLAAVARALADSPSERRTDELEQRLWDGLGFSGLAPAAVPAEVLGLDLVPTVDPGRLSLAELAKRADPDRGLGWVSDPRGPVDDELLLSCGRAQADAVGRVLKIPIRDRTRSYRRRLAAAKRRRGPSQAPVLTEFCGPRQALPEGGDFSGELGFAPELLTPDKGTLPKARILVMVDGRTVNRVATGLRHLPAVGVIDSARFSVARDWTRVVLDEVWREAREVLKTAAAGLIERGLAHVAGRGTLGPVDPPVCQALQAVCGRVFEGRPPIDPAGLAPDLTALAQGRIWSMPDGWRVSLVEIAAFHAKTKRVWLVDEQQASLPRERIMIIDLAGLTRTALKAVFTDGVRDGSGILAKERERQRKKSRRPAVACIPKQNELLAWAPVQLDPRADGLSGRGYCGLIDGEAAAGIALQIGVDGHLLCERELSHPLAARAVVDCADLEVDEAFRAPTDPGQVQTLEQAVGAVAWRALDELIETWWGGRVDPYGRARARACLQRALLQANDRRGELGQRFGRLVELTLFEDLSGRAVTGRDLLAAAERAPVRVVDAELPSGEVSDGGLVVRADALGLQTLDALLAGKLERWDDGWRAELAWRHRDQPELVLKAIRARLGPALERSGAASGLAAASLIGFGRPQGRELVAYSGGWIVNGGHPAFRAVQRLLRESQADWPDPVFHLAAAIGPVMLSEADRDAPLALLTGLAEQALAAAAREGVQSGPPQKPVEGRTP